MKLSFVSSILLSILLFATTLVSPVLANHLPPPKGYVNDFANILTSVEKDSLEQELSNYEQTSGNEIAIAVVPTLKGDTIEDFAVKAFEEWKVGKKGQDNGILILLSMQERQMRIEVGYGLEGYLTDAQAGDIIREVMAPQFKSSHYYEGLHNAILAIEDHLRGWSTSRVERESKAKDIVFGALKIIFEAPKVGIFLLFIVFMYLGSFMARSKSIWLGGALGTFLGVLIGWIMISLFEGFIWSMVLGMMGLGLDWYLSRVHQIRKSRGLSTNWFSSGGGFSSSGGGGFGGFGGGGSGGGGASGSW